MSSTAKVLIGLVVPFVAIVGLFPWYNRVSPEVLGFPFLYFWMFLWFVLTTVALFIVWRTDPRYQGRRPWPCRPVAGMKKRHGEGRRPFD